MSSAAVVIDALRVKTLNLTQLSQYCSFSQPFKAWAVKILFFSSGNMSSSILGKVN